MSSPIAHTFLAKSEPESTEEGYRTASKPTENPNTTEVLDSGNASSAYTFTTSVERGSYTAYTYENILDKDFSYTTSGGDQDLFQHTTTGTASRCYGGSKLNSLIIASLILYSYNA